VSEGKDRNFENNRSGYSRRDFLRLSRDMAIGIGAGAIFTDIILLDDAMAAIPASGGYLLVDTKKCQGCVSCMLACSLVHEGREGLSLSRIQVMQNSFERFPDDLTLHADPRYGYVRMIDARKCIGCGSCVEACPYTPSRVIWDYKKKHAQKCDLCADAPFWHEKGGPDGKQACVEVCPVGAIKFTKEIPEQRGDRGYSVNLRGSTWRILGYPAD
jgi:protein NrfC